jgi:ArsR family transcriptional regulator, arsenate/arsenite/antimonite-responsive transcriptional repressor
MIIYMSVAMSSPLAPSPAPPRLSDAEFERIAKALADPQRCEILQRTANEGELCCGSIVAACAVSQATISHHLKELANAGLLERRKDGQFAYYSFKREAMSAYLEELSARMLLGSGKRKTTKR